MPTATPTKRNLQKAAKLLQAAHDYIEAYGFDIDTYAPSHERESPRCYIGTVRLLAGARPEPGRDASKGDGPELGIALEAMDKIAKRRLGAKNALATMRKRGLINPDLDALTGRFVEELGFAIRDRAQERFPEGEKIEKRLRYETDYALKLLRTALTEIHS